MTAQVAYLQSVPSRPTNIVDEIDEVALIADPIESIAATITSADLKKHLTILASDEFEGRETGTEGNKKAARYIANQFEQFGLPKIGEEDTYFQNVIFLTERWDEVGMNINDQDYKHLWTYYTFPNYNSHQPSITADEVIFLGYGIDDEKYSDYKGVNVKDKVLLVYPGEPVNKDSISWVTKSKKQSEWSYDFMKKFKAAKKHGAKAILIIDHNLQKNLNQFRSYLLSPQLTLGKGEEPELNFANNVFISSDIAKTIIGDQFKKIVKARKCIQKKGRSKSVKLPCKFSLVQKKNTSKLVGENVLGYIEGSDPQMKDEVVIVTAHYDHLGKRGSGIYNGADDNGSGTSTVLEVAQALAEAKKQGLGPRRSVLVMPVTGEEKGLLGSQFYTEKPVFPIANTVANINVDMVGRVDEKYKDNPNYIYVIGSNRLSTELHEINETANKEYTNLVLDYTYNAEDDPNRYYYRSDHYNFASKGIPAIFYFNGTHKDYHRTSDTVEKINFEKMEIIAKLVFHTTWELANRDKRIEVDVKQ